MPFGQEQRRRVGGAATFLALLAALLGLAAAPAEAAGSDPLFVFSPQPAPPPAAPKPPPNGYLNGPCGLAVDSGGVFYVSDYYHDAVDAFTGARGYLTQLAQVDPLDGPCAAAVDSTGRLYLEDHHRVVRSYAPAAFPLVPGTAYGIATTITEAHPTGVAVDPATDDAYVDERTHLAVYNSSGAPVEVGGQPLAIGLGSLGEGYGVAVSAFPATAGYVYVPDAADRAVKVYDPALDAEDPVQTIGGPARFTSLRDSALALDRVTGEVYVLDDLQPEHAEQPRGLVQVFSSSGAYEGHLKYEVVHGAPSGLAVDNSSGSTQGRVYVTSGNTHEGAVYAYPPGAATTAAPLPPSAPPAPLGGGLLQPRIPIGAAAPPGSGIACEGDACQVLPSEPLDPTLTTLLPGLGNPKVHYRRDRHRAKRCKRKHRACRRHKRHGASASATRAGALPASAQPAVSAAASGAGAAPTAATAGLLPGAAGFDAAAYSQAGAAATLAGSHPYSLEFTLGLDQASGTEDLRNLAIELPPGLLANPALGAGSLCSAAAFAAPRSSPFEASASGESCPDRTQVGTVEVTSGAGGGQTRRFGLFDLDPADGTALQLGAAPFGSPLRFDAAVPSGAAGTHLALQVSDIPQNLQIHSLELALWGVPWDASHNPERGNCLNEAEPGFAWAKCSIGEPLTNKPLAFLTLPTSCGDPLSFSAGVGSWQQPDPLAASALSRDSGGQPAPLVGCETLGFDPHAEGFLSVKKASSASGFAFRLTNENPGLADPRLRIRSHLRKAVVELPRGVTLNPSVGAGLGVCTPAQLAAESAFNPPGAGCPNAAKIGDFSVRSPFYEGLLEGGIYLAQPDDPATATPGAENPFDSLLAVYLIAKSAQRGILIEVPGQLLPDPGDGTLTASFDHLPQLPYTDLEVNFRSGQRAPLISPPRCGPATTKITLTPWAAGAPTRLAATDSQIETGIDAGPCPDGSTPPFAPGAIAGGVNSNVGSYTPYFVHLTRKDTEQEITSYSLVLPKGITGKLAGIPFCPEAAIAASRERRGFAETASPSCPAASEVGHTLTGYGVGAALTYAPGRIYLAGPYNGSPLSLVTVNAATVGPFDLGTIVIRSAFAVDPHTAQLQIDSAASDPIPHIIDGVVLHLREIRIYMDRPQFTHNPSSCEPSQLDSTLTGSGASFADDSTATVAKHFQLLNCLTLGFRPRLGLRLRGGSRRGSYPSLRASFASRGARDSNLKRIAVTMPHSIFLAQEHIRTVCTREQFAAERCPQGSAYGRALAHTPLFDEPLRGNVYLRSSSNRLPDLVADLRSGEVRIIVEGRIGPSKSGGIRTFFDNLPDAPIERFTLTLYGGHRGLLVNSADICNSPPLASVKALGQNNIGAIFSSTLRGQCKKGKAKAKRGGQRRGGGR